MATGHDFSRAAWRRSSRSTGNGGNCVELAVLSDVVGVRDSKNVPGPVLTVPAPALTALLGTVR